MLSGIAPRPPTFTCSLKTVILSLVHPHCRPGPCCSCPLGWGGSSFPLASSGSSACAHAVQQPRSCGESPANHPVQVCSPSPASVTPTHPHSAVGMPSLPSHRACGNIRKHLLFCDQHDCLLLPLISMSTSVQTWPQSLKFIK